MQRKSFHQLIIIIIIIIKTTTTTKLKNVKMTAYRKITIKFKNRLIFLGNGMICKLRNVGVWHKR